MLLLALGPAGGAAAAEPPAEKSGNVSYVTSLDEPNAVSARFQQRGSKTLMFVSTLRGLSVYDVSDPDAPAKLGSLSDPHFENEDVDVHGYYALISNDPSEGLGRLDVIDVSDPAHPEIVGTVGTGTLDLYQGPIFNALGLIDLPAQAKAGTGHTASFVGDGRYVYLAGTAAGIDIVDLADPEHPQVVGNFPAEEATGGVASHDVQFDQAGRAWIAGYGGTAAYDVSDPLHPELVAKTDADGASGYIDDPANDGSSLNDYIHHNSLRIPNGSLAAPPAGADPEADSDVVLITEEDYNRPTCAGAGSFETWQIDGDLLHNLGRFDVEVEPGKTLCSAHYFDERGGLVAQGFYEQGTRFLDVSDPSAPRQVGYWIPAVNMTWGALFVPSDPSGEIVYALDNLRGIDVLRIDRPDPAAPPAPGPPAGASSPPPGSPPRPSGPIEEPSGSAPDLAITIRDARSRVRRGRQLHYRVRVRNHGGTAARGAIVQVKLPRAVRHLRGGTLRTRRTVRWRIVSLEPGKRRTLNLYVRVRPRARARALTLTARARGAGERNRKDNRATDTTRIRRPSTQGAATALMAAVIAPPVAAATVPTALRTFAGLCRILVT